MTVDELRDALASFTQADYLRLEKAARLFSRGSALEWNELLNEAVKRGLTGSRRCPRDVAPPVFLANAMKSIASDERAKGSRRPAQVSLSATGTDGRTIDLPSPELNAEDMAVAEDYDAHLARVEALFSNDEDAQMVIMAKADGMSATQIREMQSWDAKHLATVNRRIRRTVHAAFPNGRFA